MKIVIRLLLVVTIAALLYLCVQSIMGPITFDKQKKLRENAIVERLIAIRNAQIGYKGVHSVYAGTFSDLQKFLNEERLPFLLKIGELTDEQLKAGLTEQEAVKQGIIRRDTTWVIAKDTLLSAGFNVATMAKVPGFENYEFEIDTATLTSPSGYIVPVFVAAVPYEVYLGDLNKQLLINLKDKTGKLKRYQGLRVGSVTEINNNAGNWE